MLVRINMGEVSQRGEGKRDSKKEKGGGGGGGAEVESSCECEKRKRRKIKYKDHLQKQSFIALIPLVGKKCVINYEHYCLYP